MAAITNGTLSDMVEHSMAYKWALTVTRPGTEPRIHPWRDESSSPRGLLSPSVSVWAIAVKFQISQLVEKIKSEARMCSSEWGLG